MFISSVKFKETRFDCDLRYKIGLRNDNENTASTWPYPNLNNFGGQLCSIIDKYDINFGLVALMLLV